MYWLSFYVEKQYPAIKPRKWWKFWEGPEIEILEGSEQLNFELTEAEAQLFIKDDKAFTDLFKRFFPTATHLQLEHGNMASPSPRQQRHGAEVE